MKNGMVVKAAETERLTDEMALVNAYSRRELSPDEVYLFTVVLCDNDVDRDHERFTTDSLYSLEKLFVGKTGILDHDPAARNQKARIISCRVERVEGAVNVLGDALYRLTARAYIRRTEANRELIEAIEAGIVKEVSVGCSVEKTLCSVCGSDMRSPQCSHIKGRTYSGTLCVGELCDPTDAYEFSFVAVPAQRGAGVIKTGMKEKHMDTIKTIMESEKELVLSQSDVRSLKEYVGELEKKAQYADAYRSQLCEGLRRAAAERHITLDYDVSQSIIGKLDVTELQALTKALQTGSKRAAAPQLCGVPAVNAGGNTEFRI